MKQIGIYDVYGGEDAEKMVGGAIRRARRFPFAKITYRLVVRVLPAREMPPLPGERANIPSEGFARGHEILINKDIPISRQTYTVLHETGHHIKLTAAQMLDLMLLMKPVPAGMRALKAALKLRPWTKADRRLVRQKWVGDEYLFRPREAYPDDLTEAGTVPKQESPWEGWYKRDTPDKDLPKVLDITNRVVEPDPDDGEEPEVPPIPLPPPPPDCEEVLALLNAERAAHDASKLELGNKIEELGLMTERAATLERERDAALARLTLVTPRLARLAALGESVTEEADAAALELAEGMP